jgi:parallel beta-helix repeat protein
VRRYTILFALVLSLVARPWGIAATITVAKSGGDYSTISEAMKAAKAGDTVLVKRGSYRETVRLKEGVTLKGEKRDDCVIVGPNDHAVVIRGLKGAAVKDLTLRYSAGPRRRGTKPKVRSTLYIYNSTATVEGCLVERGTGSGIRVVGSKSRVMIRGNVCRENRLWGILLQKGASGTIKGNTCRKNGYTGIAVYDKGTRAVVSDNTCASNDMNGVFFRFGATGTIKGNTCEGNGLDGIIVSGVGAAPKVVSNMCRKNARRGIFVGRGAGGTLEGNTCEANGTSGIAVCGTRTSPVLRANVCRGNRESGIYVFGGSSCTIDSNICEGNGYDGIAVSDPGTVPIVRANLSQHNFCGLRVYNHASPKVTLNIFVFNRKGICNGRITDRPDGDLVDLSYNCVWGNSAFNYELCAPSESDIQQDPRVAKQKDGSYRLAPGSPCVRAGPKGENIGGLDVASGK